MQRLKNHWLFLLACLIVSPHSIAALNIIFVNPGFADSSAEINTTGNFWFKVSKIMRNAADDLDINLHIKYANRNHILMKELISEAIKDQPDYLVVVDEKSVVSKYLAKLNTKNIPIYFLYSRPAIEQLTSLKRNGVNIIGSVIPDNYAAGKTLAQQLLIEHTTTSDQPANMLALIGDYTTPASLERAAGLDEFIKRHQDVNFIGKEVANWSEQQSYIKTLAFLEFAPEINIIWCANDAIGFGVKRALQARNNTDKVVVGGMNWDSVPQGIEALDITLGGHVLLGAYALINIVDHHNARIYLNHTKLAIFNNLTAEIEPLAKHINETDLADIDFSQFSKTATDPQPFTVDNLVKALNK
ncbi:ABC transporter substrate-binding protein [Pseudoalteromonas prydzensis]|uniref:ABC transporter substrate-binding protein n=1 Tax=Pseudoalteromonas prydzensis TaxID=182141 RepID=UPI0007E50C83|nr:ABC transporter substrate-binding protein [Pseudoalteromonas prydzensis]MBE0380461.1 hypothetical protein [Pseudoalteromonas prydzensis ACAM 620]